MASLMTSPRFKDSRTSSPASTFPTGLRGIALFTSPTKKQSSPPEAKNATSPLVKANLGFSTPTLMEVNMEKPRLGYAKGEVAFLASGGLLCFFVSDVKSAMPLNPVGKVDAGLEVLASLKPGDVIRLAKEEV